MSNKVMYFQNPEMKDGINLTVRRGVKWAHESGLFSYGEPELEIGRLIIEETCVMRACDIPETWLHNEHDPKCRTLKGLLKVLDKVYTSFVSQEIVTLIWFTVNK